MAYIGTSGDDQHLGGQIVMHGGDGYDLLKRIGKTDKDGVVTPPKPNGFLYGEGGNDSLIAYDSSDRLYGGSGDDYMVGDRLYGGAGNDQLKAGNGYVRGETTDPDPVTVSRMLGGGGIDSFTFNASNTMAILPDFKEGDERIVIHLTDNGGVGYNHHFDYDIDKGKLTLEYRIELDPPHHRKTDTHESIVVAKVPAGTHLDPNHDVILHVDVIVA